MLPRCWKLVCPSGVAAGPFLMTCFNSIRVIPRSAFLLPFLIAPQAKRVPGALCSPFSRRFYNCCCRRTFFSPNNQNNTIQISVLRLVPDAKMEPVPCPAALCCILDLNHQVGITLGDNPSPVAGSFQESLCAFPMKGLFVL